jgi:Fe-Mn family superoxide dismutase
MKKREFLRLTGIMGAGVVVSPFLACSDGGGAATGGESAAATDAAAASPEIISFKLPELGYPYDALAPNIDAMTMEIHHSKHHAGYVRKLNAALEGSSGYGGMEIADILEKVSADETGIRNNGGGHFNHTLFWQVIAPGGAKAPDGALLDAINKSFMSYEAFAEEFANAAKTRFGSGWAWLCVDENNELFVSSTPNQDNPLMTNIVEKTGLPILGIDVWEHAYYLNYQNRRGDYIGAFMEVVNWTKVSELYEIAIS